MCGCNKGRIQPTVPETHSNSILAHLRNRGLQHVAAPAPRYIHASGHAYIETSKWGPPLWKMMHILSVASTELDTTAWMSLFQALQDELPCPVCRSHAQEWLKQNPDFTTMGIQQYVLQFHNQVNARRNVPLWSIQQVQTTYSVGGKEQQLSLVTLLMSSVAMMPRVTVALQSILASVSG
jgi:hypothetical protein